MTSSVIRFSHDDQLWFAGVSGDYNPIHVDATYARRTVYGRQVVHGVHMLLRGLELAVGHVVDGERISGIAARFPSASFLDQDMSVQTKRADDEVVIELVRDGSLLMAATVQVSGSIRDGAPVETHAFAHTAPQLLEAGVEAHIDVTDRLAFDVGGFQARFSGTAAKMGLDLVGLLLAATRSVGMTVPGLHSLIVDVEVDAAEGAAETHVHVEANVTRVRVRPVDVHLRSGTLTGRVRTMFRPAPVEQPAFSHFQASFAGARLDGWNAWVIGGSRGIGEALAKHLAAGGADVTVTYVHGAADARRVQEEISVGGGTCHVARVDVLEDGWADRVAAESPTHLFYLCSPKILPRDVNDDGAAPGFSDYVDFYVGGLFRLADTLAQHGEPARIYFPSSVYVEEAKEGFFEYAAAKRLAEQLAADLTARHESLFVGHTRLPEILTDQTARILPSRARPASDFVNEIVNRIR